MRVEGWPAGHPQSTAMQNALQRAMSVALVSHTQDAAVVAEYATTTMHMYAALSIHALEDNFNGQPTHSS